MAKSLGCTDSLSGISAVFAGDTGPDLIILPLVR